MPKYLLSVTIVSLFASVAGAKETRAIAQNLECKQLKVVELTLENLGPEQGAPNSAWISDKSIYLGWDAEGKMAQENAVNACVAAKHALESCQNAKINSLGHAHKYGEAVKKLSGCK